MSQPPMGTRFQLGDRVTEEQRAFLDEHGFLVFDQVVRPEEIARIAEELDRIEARWRAEGRKWVNGIPVFWGRGPDGRDIVQRFAFTSLFSEAIRELVHDPRFEPIRQLVGEGTRARIGDREADGVVVNRYYNVPGSASPRLGWHTDGLRDLFMGRLPRKMLNVGLHLDDCPADNGGLRLIPGSHRQGWAGFVLRKPYFVDHRTDPEEICIETRAGDLTVHDGRLWHRVARSARTGEASLRRSMYVPYLTGPFAPKDENSPTPLYHHAGRFLRWARRVTGR
ncbi:MAG: phytanoyl-CoA dioxygenase family protein [Myxococcota bacterium]